MIAPSNTILIVEDDNDIIELLRANLTEEGYQVLIARTGEEGRELARKKLPGLILLDIMLPGADGLELCRSLKSDSKTSSFPIILLTAKSEELDIVTGLEVGADDYITKPFSPKVLIARIRNVLRRAKLRLSEDSIIEIAGISIDMARHEVKTGTKKIALTPTEFGILSCLTNRPGWVFSRNQIVDEVFDEETNTTDRSIDIQIAGLRKKLRKFGELIETVRGVGYRFKDSQ